MITGKFNEIQGALQANTDPALKSLGVLNICSFCQKFAKNIEIQSRNEHFSKTMTEFFF